MRGKVFRWDADKRCGWIRTDHEEDVFILEAALPDCLHQSEFRIGLNLLFDNREGIAANVYLVTDFNPPAGSLRG